MINFTLKNNELFATMSPEEERFYEQFLERLNKALTEEKQGGAHD